MTYASIKLTDRDGKLDMHVEYSGGMDERLPSHQHIFLMVANMEQMAVPEGDPVHILGAPDGKLPTIKRNADGQVVGWGAAGDVEDAKIVS